MGYGPSERLASSHKDERERQELEMLLADGERLIREMQTLLDRARVLHEEQRRLIARLAVRK